MAFSRLLVVIVVLSFLFGCTTFRTPTNVLQKRPPADQILFPQGKEKDELLLYNEIAQYIYIHSYYYSEGDKESFEALLECFVENVKRKDLNISKNLSKENYILRELCFQQDTHALFFSPEEYRDFQIEYGRQFPGIGVFIRWNDTKTHVVVREVFKKSPAKKAGIRKGDEIRAVEKNARKAFISLENENMPIQDVARIIRGKEGTIVRVFL